MKRSIAFLLLAAAAGSASAQTRATHDSLKTPVARPAADNWHPVTLSVFTSGVYDSNIGRDLVDPVQSAGFVVGAGARYQAGRVRPPFAASYEIARHRYTHSEQFDRVSHHFNAIFTRWVNNAFYVETIGDVGIKGSSEDRDVGNNFTLLPRVNYRITSSQRLRLYGAYRLRRYDVDSSANATNTYAGVEARTDMGKKSRLEGGFRIESNDAKADRRTYSRRTWYATFTRTPTVNDFLTVDFNYRSQRYDKRLVKVNGVELIRHDHRYSPEVEWTHRLPGGFSLTADYDFEYRTSNDPDKGYRDHVVTLTGRKDW